ncbi:mucoidy inhibitor MuiA family protein [Catalinimonas niigatensis]|uniref:mucoidy inhibitor MuiA family protein n=1 Tax=Catalinimonas niigatensis TaxID=1397264 RepID=UPI0026658D01|nr:mucoidy inhibitor MuiA family protein [Catalinimonas niigatensis]WPP48973.1 mucoidy inhibitor MuiA family protein [Catalinimonas niigatensis]
MKKLVFLGIISLITFGESMAQELSEQKTDSDLDSVKVFLQGAQMHRSAQVKIKSGKSSIVLQALSPYINPQSIQVKSTSDLLVLSVNHRLDYLGEKAKSVLQDSVEAIEDSISVETAMQEVLDEELEFLKKNNDIAGTENGLSLNNLKEVSEYYQQRMKAIRLEKLAIKNRVQELQGKLNKLRRQLAQWNDDQSTRGEIVIAIESKIPQTVELLCSYMVAHASWFPVYDLRAKDVQSPVELMYKAKIQQSTGEDWNDVKLAFSNANPTASGEMPALNPWYLDFNTPYPQNLQSLYTRANPNVRQVSGRVTEGDMGDVLPGVNVIIKGTSIGTVTDMNGEYNISIPQGANSLVFSFIGYMSQEVPIANERMDIILQPDVQSLSEVVVTGYDDSRALQGKVSGVQVRGGSSVKAKALPVPTTQVENQTSVEFSVDIPYTVNSDGKSYTVDLAKLEIPAHYEYQCVPKLDKDAFLIARIIDWEQYNLLEGEVNLFFEHTYVGKSLLDVRFVKDTLDISLGRDRNVGVERSKVQDYTRKRFIGSRQEESRGWRLEAKNSKAQNIHLIVYDQIPVSRLSDIAVEAEDFDGGKLNEETGIIQWSLDLSPNSSENKVLRFSVKYPKDQHLFLE